MSDYCDSCGEMLLPDEELLDVIHDLRAQVEAVQALNVELKARYDRGERALSAAYVLAEIETALETEADS